MTIHIRTRHCLATAAALGALATAGPAFADDQEKKVADVVDKLAYLLDQQTFGDPKWTETVSTMSGHPDPSLCFDAVKAAKAAGMKADTKVHAAEAFRWKSVQEDDVGRYITLADVEGLCTRYDDTYVHEYVEAALVEAFLAKGTMERPVEGQFESEAEHVGILGAECAKRVDAAIAHGLPATEVIESPRYDMPGVELGQAKATLCQPAIDFGAKRAGEINNLAQSKQDEIIAIYKKAGFKGKKLELFVSYGKPEDAGFLAAGCETWVESIGAIKKAKKLFVWLEGDAGYTIRKFTFKGNGYSVSEHVYSTKEGAYSGCR